MESTPSAAVAVPAHAPQVTYASADELLAGAPLDLVEKDVEDVFGGKTVRIRSLTAAQSAAIQQGALRVVAGQQPRFIIADAEVKQFELGVVQPKLDHNQVVRLYQNSGASFKKVCEAIDEISGTNKNAWAEAEAAFPGSEES